MSNILSSKVGYKYDTDPFYKEHMTSIEESYRIRHYNNLTELYIYGIYALVGVGFCSFVLYKNRKK